MNTANKTLNFQEMLNPQMITLAREFAGMTQSALAEELVMTQGTISKLEEGLNQGDPELLEKLSNIFQRPISFFTQKPQIPLSLEGHYRKKSSLPKKLIRSIDARMNIERIQINKLIDSCDLDLASPPDCDPDEYQKGPKEIAQLLRRHLHLPPGPVTNVTAAIEKAGCIVRFLDFGTLKIDGYSVLTNAPIIFINKAYPIDRRRLTLAHEFGHVIMHRGRLRPNAEDEAFEFAGEFLMPEREIKSSLYPLNLQKLARLKLKWRVSMAAILQHAKRIGAVNDRYYCYMRSQISKHGYTKEEPYEDQIPVEKPQLLTQVFKHFKNDLEYNIDSMSQLLNASHAEIKSLNQPNHERFTVV